VIRQHRFAFAFLGLLATILFIAPLLRQEVFVMRDHFDYFQPLRWFTAQELRAGHIPWWNPYSASGEPWMANPQTGIFYPPAWLFLVLPFATAYMLFLQLHLLVLAWGAYLLFARSNSRGAAMVGAAALLFSGPVLSLMDVSNNLATLVWIPLALWCASTGAWKRGGIVLALAFLGGEPFFAAVAALLYVLVRRNRDVLGTAVIAAGLSAVQLLPFLDMLRGSDRAGGMEAPQILRDSMPLADWARVFLPPPLFATPARQAFIPTLYAGVVVAILAVVGLSLLRKRRDLGAWLALLAVVMVIAAGPAFLTRLPLTLFRYPARLVPVGAMAIAALAAAGWDRLRPDRRWADLLVIAILVADLLPRLSGLLVTGAWRPDVVPYAPAIGARQKILRFDPDEMARVESIAGYLNLYDRRFDAWTAAPVVNAAYLRWYVALQSHPTPKGLSDAAIGALLSPRVLPSFFSGIARAGGTMVFAVHDPRAMAVCVSKSGVKTLEWSVTTSQAMVTVDANEPCTVTIAQQDDPGWTVSIDGRQAEKSRFSEVFRAVEVPAGRHVVVWRYRPRMLFPGGVMTVVTLLAMTVPLFVKRGRAGKFFVPSA
jgi:hypothetical protein